jgi:hypothetical protein
MQETYKYLGFVSFFMLFLGLIFVVIKWPKGLSSTFSQHVAQSKVSIVYYQFLFLIALPVLLLYVLKWLEPTFDLGILFSLMIILSAVFQVGCTFIPETGGTKTKVHRTLAFASADLLIPVMIIMALNSNLGLFARCVCATSAIIMTLIALVLVPTKGRHDKVLIFQAIFYAVFFGGLLAPAF